MSYKKIAVEEDVYWQIKENASKKKKKIKDYMRELVEEKNHVREEEGEEGKET